MLVRGLGQQLESVSQRLARQQALSQQVARHGAATHRWLVLTLVVVALLALCNAYLLYKSSGVCDLTQVGAQRDTGAGCRDAGLRSSSTCMTLVWRPRRTFHLSFLSTLFWC